MLGVVLNAVDVAIEYEKLEPLFDPEKSAAARRFADGDPVRTREIHPPGHTRLPRYCRDKPGTIAKIHGPHVFPDANALGHGEERIGRNASQRVAS